MSQSLLVVKVSALWTFWYWVDWTRVFLAYFLSEGFAFADKRTGV